MEETVHFDIFEMTENLAGLEPVDMIEKITDLVPADIQAKYEFAATEKEVNDINMINLDFNQNRIGMSFDVETTSPIFVGYMKFAECHTIFTFEPDNRANSLVIFGETLGQSFDGDRYDINLGEEMEEALMRKCYDITGVELVGEVTASRTVITGEVDRD